MSTAAVISQPVLSQNLSHSRQKTDSVTLWGRTFVSIVLVVLGASMVIGFSNGVLILTLVSFLACVAGLFIPVVGLFGMGIFCTLDAVARTMNAQSGLRWNTFNYLLLVVIVLNIIAILRYAPLPLRIFSLFLSVLGLQLIYSTELMLGVQHLLGGFIVFGLFAFFLRGTENPQAWAWFGLINGIVGAVGGFIFFRARSDLIAVNPNALAYFPLTALFSICLGFRFVRATHLKGSLFLILALANIGWTFLTGSRGGLLIAICCLIFLLKHMRRVSHLLTLVALTVVIVGLISTKFAAMKEYTIGRLNKSFNSDASIQNRTSGRSDIAKVGIAMFLRYPWGVGTGAFESHYAEESNKVHTVFRPGRTTAAHAGWIKILAENGVVGIAIFACFIGSFAYLGWVKRRQDVLDFGILVSMSLAVAFIATEFQCKGLWMLVAGTSVILARGFASKRTRPKRYRRHAPEPVSPLPAPATSPV